MKTPLPVTLALGGSVILGAAGLCDLIGVFAALGVEGEWIAKAPLALAGAVAGLIVWGGEAAKAKLLEWGQAASGLRQVIARAGWAFFVSLSICLSHSGLIAAERAILSPVISPLARTVAEARADLETAQDAEDTERARIASRVADANSEIASTPGRRERDALRAERDAVQDGEAAAMRPLELATAGARRDLAQARAALAGAPKGFLSLSIPLPVGLGDLALIPWLFPIAIEYLTGLVGWLAPPRRDPRAIQHDDVLSLDPAGLELLANDPDLLRRIGSKHASLAAKATHVLNPRGRKAS